LSENGEADERLPVYGLFKQNEDQVAASDLSSCSATDEEARRNIRDAVRGFLASSAERSVLSEILDEAYARSLPRNYGDCLEAGETVC
jgi:hypothetical protein